MRIENNIILGDCLDVLPKIPNEIFDLIIIDTPYNKKKDFKNDNYLKKEFLNLFENWINNIIPKLKDTGSFYCFIDDDLLYEFKEIIDKYLIFKRYLHWYKEAFTRSVIKNYEDRIEYILFYTKSDKYTFNILREKPSKSTIKRFSKYANKKGDIPYEKLSPHDQKKNKKENYDKNPRNIFRGALQGNVFKIPTATRGNNPETLYGKHPTMKPTKLIEIFIKASSNEGNLVGDFFVGSGTTLVVAKKLRRKYFGCEIEPKYYEIAKKRLDSIMFTERNIKDYYKRAEVNNEN